MILQSMNSSPYRRWINKAIGIACWITGLAGMFQNPVDGQDGSPPKRTFRIAFSKSLFTDINVNDATAALRISLQTIARQRHVQIEPEAWVVDTREELAEAIRSKRVDAVEVTSEEYVALEKEVRFAPMFTGSSGGSITEEYVVVVSRNGKIESLADLQGRHLNVYAHYRACLAQIWLDNLLAGQGLPPTAQFFSQIAATSKLAQVVLPVFFGQCDACLVTRSGFEIMCEMNPQLSKQLKVIAKSPGVVSAVFCFRADVPDEIKGPYIAGLREMHLTAGGQQALTIFHRDKLEEHSADCMQSALDLVETHGRLFGETNQLQVTTVGPMLPQEEKAGVKK